MVQIRVKLFWKAIVITHCEFEQLPPLWEDNSWHINIFWKAHFLWWYKRQRGKEIYSSKTLDRKGHTETKAFNYFRSAAHKRLWLSWALPQTHIRYGKMVRASELWSKGKGVCKGNTEELCIFRLLIVPACRMRIWYCGIHLKWEPRM